MGGGGVGSRRREPVPTAVQQGSTGGGVKGTGRGGDDTKGEHETQPTTRRGSPCAPVLRVPLCVRRCDVMRCTLCECWDRWR